MLGRLTSWQRAAHRVGSAYAIAADRHQRAVAERARGQALTEGIMWGVLTACTAGTLSWLSSSLQAGLSEGSIRELVFNSLEDTVQSGLGEGIDIVQAATAPKAEPVSQNPQVYQNQVVDLVLADRQHAFARFADWARELREQPLGAFDTFDAARFRRAQQQWAERSNRYQGEESLPSQEDMAKKLERGMWARWIPPNIRPPRTLHGNPGEGSITVAGYSKPGAAIEGRFTALRITAESGVGDFGWWTSEGEMDQVVSWAQSHRPERFIQ